MVKKVIMLCGGASVGKTAVVKHLVSLFIEKGLKPSVCKIDCLHSDDLTAFSLLKVPMVLGLSGDICPDHYLVSNLEEIIDWASKEGSDILFIETAGLCHRCSPATSKSISICVVDCSGGIGAPKKLGPMLTHSDIVLLSKIDTISQAEREIFAHNIRLLNPSASVICVDGLSGYGIDLALEKILDFADLDNFSEDTLRYTMPAAVCSYCVGEMRVGKNYQQGIVEKMNLEASK